MMGKGSISGQANVTQFFTAEHLRLLEYRQLHSSNSFHVAFRKRPVKLAYDKNEYWMFRFPSEQAFLLVPFESADIFGKRKGITHSTHINPLNFRGRHRLT